MLKIPHPVIYLCGPISGMRKDNRENFKRTEEFLIPHFPEYRFINPFREKEIFSSASCWCCQETCRHFDWRRTLLLRLATVRKADVLWLLGGFEQSLGCVMELHAFIAGREVEPMTAGKALKAKGFAHTPTVVFPSNFRPDKFRIRGIDTARGFQRYLFRAFELLPPGE